MMVAAVWLAWLWATSCVVEVVRLMPLEKRGWKLFYGVTMASLPAVAATVALTVGQ